jgi:hypothetical protein
MASSINASTSGSGGVITTADNSGILNLQSSGTTVATVGPTGFSTPSTQTINVPNTFGYKNKLINGSFLVWQRGTSVTPPLGSLTSYVSDRWASYQTGAATAVYQSAGFSPFQYCAAWNGVASNTEVSLLQCVESTNSYPLVGSYATFSFWAYASTSKTFSISIGYPTTVDGFSAVTTVYTQSFSHPGAGSWQQFTYTTSSVLGASFANGTRIVVTTLNCTTGTFAITGAQLEVGSQATSYDVRPYGTELALCYRYYNSLVTGSIGWNINSTTADFFFAFPTMRTAPSATYVAGSGYINYGPGGQQTTSSITFYAGYVTGYVGGANIPSGLTTNAGSRMGMTVNLSAEL